MERVWVGLGSNLSEPLQQVNIAIKSLAHLPKTRLIACSSYYRSRPLGLSDQDDFLNVVVALDTTLSPEVLLDHTQEIELRQGRIRKVHRWGPRTLDLDILLFGNRIIAIPSLTVPHYDMYNREFVLYPLVELAPDLQFPNGEWLIDRLCCVPRNGLEYWNH
ncbi:MAG: 2-amino-4-hydroxy-6-hydroxymethyldihydropteridine diphosphokinase [Sodalis sp. (in: enterobacteria)]